MVGTGHAVESLAKRLAEVRARMANAALRSGRSPDEITLVAIGKTHTAEYLRMAMAAGITDLGENRVQEAEDKINELGRSAARWHLVGHLQPNKVRRAVRCFDVIHSVDSPSLATRLDRILGDEGIEKLSILVQVDLGGEETKTGVAEAELPNLLETISSCSRLKCDGLMTLPPFFESPQDVRPYFRRLRILRDEFQAKEFFGSSQGALSMGMTHDFEVAIEEGATMVRIGTAIFGERTATGDTQ
jgi:pyridoxal phosphate enzyme (YggS family)